MHPQLDTFLLGIRRELASPDLFVASLDSGASPVMAARAASGLAHIVFGAGGHAALLQHFAGRMREVMRDVDGALGKETAATEPLDAVSLAEQYQAHVSAGLADLAQRGAETELARLVAGVAALEQDYQRAYAEAVAELIAEAEAAAAGFARAAPPDPAELTALVRAEVPNAAKATVSNLRSLKGFNSKEIYWVAVEGVEGWPTESVFRREPPYNVTGMRVADERRLVNLLHAAGLPVPRALIAERGDAGTPGFIITERVPGAPRTPTTLGPGARTIVGQIAGHAAHFHALDWDGAAAAARGDARMHTMERATYFHDRWRAMRTEDSAIIEAGYQWLRAHAGRIDPQVALVHGDFNMRNILIADDAVSAVLDWELSHPGSPAEDLAHMAPDVAETMPEPEFLALYNARARRPVGEDELRYFKVFAAYWQAALSAVTYSGFVNRKDESYISASVCHEEYKKYCFWLANRMGDRPSV